MAENEKAGGDYTPRTPEQRRQSAVDAVRRGLEECGNLKWSHYVDLTIRRDGKDIHVEGDWLKYVEDVCPEVKPGERERCAISELPWATVFLDSGERYVLIDNSTEWEDGWPSLRLRDGDIVIFTRPETEVEVIEKPAQPQSEVEAMEEGLTKAPP